jgi:SAM-dependent methyltransferase
VATVFDGPRREFDAPLAACPLCSSRQIASFVTDHRQISIWRCGDCQLRFMNPQYSDAALGEYYARYTSRDPAELLAGRNASRRARKQGNIDLLKPLVRAGGRVLSVGCGDGLELLLLRESGFRVEAYDVDPATATAVESATGIRVHSGDLFDLPIERRAFDCVFLDQVLEHPKNPADYLRLIRELLAPGGLCYLGVPNIGSLSHRLKTLRDRLGLRAADRIGRHYDTWHHIHYYRPAVFRRTLPRRFGLEIVSILGEPEPGAGRLSHGLRRKYPLLESTMIVMARRPLNS